MANIKFWGRGIPGRAPSFPRAEGRERHRSAGPHAGAPDARDNPDVLHDEPRVVPSQSKHAAETT